MWEAPLLIIPRPFNNNNDLCTDETLDGHDSHHCPGRHSGGELMNDDGYNPSRAPLNWELGIGLFQKRLLLDILMTFSVSRKSS